MEDYAEIRTMLEEGLAVRKEKEKDWERWRNVYRYATLGESDRDDSQVRIYLARMLVQILLPSLYFKNPYVMVTPLVYYDESAEERAHRMEVLVNYFISTPHIMRVKPNMRAAILDAMVYNTGIVETKWNVPALERPTQGEGDRLTFDVMRGDDPYILRVSPWDFVEDAYSMDDLEGARWASRRKWVPVAAVRHNKAYSKDVRVKVDTSERKNPIRKYMKALHQKGIINLKDRRMRGLYTSIDEEMEGLVQVWEFIDLKHNRRVEFTPQVDGFLRDEENPYSHLTKFPYKKLMFNYDTDMFSPQSILEQIIPQQREINHINSRQHDAIKRFCRMFEIQENALTDERQGLADLERGRDGAIIRVNQRGLIGEIPLETKNMDGWGALKQQELADAARALGIPPTQTSTGHQKFKSATEVAQISQAFDIRLDDMREQVADWFEAVVTDLGDNIQAFMDVSRTFKIAGQPQTIGPEDIGSERYSYEMQLSESSPDNQNKRLERLTFLYQMVQNEPLLDRQKILKELLQAMGFNTPEQFMAIPEEAGMGNIPPYGAEGAMSPEAGAQAMAGGPAEQAMMMGGMPAEAMLGGDLAALLGGGGA